MAVKANALILLANLKTFLGILGDTHDTILEMLINHVSTLMQKRMKRELIYDASLDEYYDGNGRVILVVSRFPIESITSITENDAALTEDTDFKVYAESGYIKRLSGSWPIGKKNIEVKYKAGYWSQSQTSSEPEVPDDIQLECMKQIGHEWKRAKGEDWGETSKSFPDGSVTKLCVNLLPSVEAVCKSYVRPIV